MPSSHHPPKPELALLTRLAATLGEPLDLGQTPQGHRRVVPIRGGRLEGPRLTGQILDGGADWQVVRPAGWVEVEARYTVLAEGGQLISIVSRGVRHGPEPVMRRLLAGESPDPTEYRFRTAMTFETAEDTELGWLNHIVALASAVREPSQVTIDVYEVL